MLISLFGGAGLAGVADVVDRARVAAEAQLDGIWVPQTPTVDTLCALAVASREVPGIRLGTAVVPIQGRHPYPLAQAALTVADSAGPGRFTLGVGVTHQVVSEAVYGVPYRGVVGRCAEHLAALAPLLGRSRTADVTGEHVVARGSIDLDVTAPGLLLAALGPRMLDLAGTVADGTITWMTGPRTLASHVVPRIRHAARAAGRPTPRVVVGLPVCVTDRGDVARRTVADAMAAAADLPSYRRMLAAEEVGAPVDIALIGSEEAVARRLAELEGAGATEVVANLIGPAGTAPATLRLLGDLAADRARR